MKRVSTFSACCSEASGVSKPPGRKVWRDLLHLYQSAGLYGFWGEKLRYEPVRLFVDFQQSLDSFGKVALRGN